jgi:hypothetical protein
MRNYFAFILLFLVFGCCRCKPKQILVVEYPLDKLPKPQKSKGPRPLLIKSRVTLTACLRTLTLHPRVTCIQTVTCPCTTTAVKTTTVNPCKCCVELHRTTATRTATSWVTQTFVKNVCAVMTVTQKFCTTCTRVEHRQPHCEPEYQTTIVMETATVQC